MILRKLKEDDFEGVHNYISRPETGIYLHWESDSEEEARSYIRLAIDEAEKDPVFHYHYAAILKETNKIIGGCRVSCDGSLCWVLPRDYWNQGFVAEMGKAMMQYGFVELKLHRLFATCDADNTGSHRLMEKLGMRQEGLFIEALPAHKLSDRKYSDQLRYAILKDEWEAQKEIAYYNALPVKFNDFIEMPELTDGVIRLVCTAKKPAISERNMSRRMNLLSVRAVKKSVKLICGSVMPGLAPIRAAYIMAVKLVMESTKNIVGTVTPFVPVAYYYRWQKPTV